MDPIRDQLTALVNRIEMSTITDEDKNKIYLSITNLLDATVLPIFLKHLPKDQLELLSNDVSKVTVDAYSKLISTTYGDGVALTEMDVALKDVVQKIDAALKQEGI